MLNLKKSVWPQHHMNIQKTQSHRSDCDLYKILLMILKHLIYFLLYYYTIIRLADQFRQI